MGSYLLWASGSGQRTGDYDTPIGKILNSGTRMTQTSAGVARYGEHGFWGASYDLQDGRYDIPSGRGLKPAAPNSKPVM